MTDEHKFIQTGIETVRRYIKMLPSKPGVYRMLGEKDDVLYVGKAKSLKNRVSSYTNIKNMPMRLQRMVAMTRRMEFVHTQTEAEALLLESNLIKKLKPRFNVLLRDDKSFPYILITGDHDYPLVTKHRGAKKRKGQYYGPFAGAGDVNRTIAILQRAFMLRSCSDNVFAGRERPCLQYHIKRCTAPCVGLVSREDYAAQVGEARAFLDGQSEKIQARYARAMQKASDEQDYEEAAMYRDRIRVLRNVQAHQDINIASLGNADVMALVQKEGLSCVQVFFFRGGRNYGNRSYFPRHDSEEKPEEILSAFMAQFYENKPVPKTVLVNYAPAEKKLLEEAFASKVDFNVKISVPQRGGRKKAMEFVEKNARQALDRKIAGREGEEKLLSGVAELFGLGEAPQRIEVYDNSHISGSNMTGAMIVAGPEGFEKNAYRKFNIKRAEKSDDYGMMREVLSRRFKRALKKTEGAAGEEIWPDIVLIDGGLGQLNAAYDVLEDMGIDERVNLVAIAKGKDRHAGRETFFMRGRKPFKLRENDPVLHYLQRLRDEAHRFAIGAHRARRKKQISASPLDDLKGIGPKRKKALLHYFGSGKAVADAGVEDLQKVEGISKARAQAIYDHFH